MNRRHFLGAMAATASGLLVPEWLLDPPKGRSMVAVPEMPIYRINGIPVTRGMYEDFVAFDRFMRAEKRYFLEGSAGAWEPTGIMGLAR